MLQMKKIYWGQAYEDPNLHLKNFINAYASFDIAYITQESIRLRLFPFSLMVMQYCGSAHSHQDQSLYGKILL